MKNIVFLSDCHLSAKTPRARLDDIKETGFRKLGFVCNWAKQNDAFVLSAGDLTHEARSWDLVSDLIAFMRNARTGIPFWGSVFGQHDTYMYSALTRRKTMLGTLEAANLVTILDGCTRFDGFSIYGCHYGQVPEGPANKDDFNILVIHAPIAREALWPGQNYMDASKFLRNNEFDIIVCGDIHQKFYFDLTRGDGPRRYIINAGPMIRREATTYNLQHEPGFWVYNIDEDAMKWVGIPHAPADEVLTHDHIDLQEVKTGMLDGFVESVKVEADSDVRFVANLWRTINNNNIEQPVVDVLAEIIGEEQFYGNGK